jgi:hypothetical protein
VAVQHQQRRHQTQQIQRIFFRCSHDEITGLFPPCRN